MYGFTAILNTVNNLTLNRHQIPRLIYYYVGKVLSNTLVLLQQPVMNFCISYKITAFPIPCSSRLPSMTPNLPTAFSKSCDD